MRNQAFYVLTHEYFGTYFLNGTSQLKEQRSASVVQSSLFASIGECLTRKTAGKEIYFVLQWREIHLMNISFQHIPFWMILAESLTGHRVHLIK